MDPIRCLIVVDVQADFVDAAGALPVPGAADILAPIRAALATPQLFPGGIYFSHDDKLLTDSFRGFPVHCIRGTPGAALHPGLGLASAPAHTLIAKRRSMSAFGSTRALPEESEVTPLREMLLARGVTHAVVCGLALEYCVLDTGCDAAAMGLHTCIVTAASRAFRADSPRATATLAKRLGAHPNLRTVATFEEACAPPAPRGASLTIGVLGSGSWGTALAIHLASCAAQRHAVALLDCRSHERAAAVSSARENARYLPGIPLPPTLAVLSLQRYALQAADMLVLALPTTAMREVLSRIAPALSPHTLLVCAAKGIEEHGGQYLTMGDVLLQVLPAHARLVALAGPSFAKEVALGKPTAVVVAAAQEATAAAAAAAFHSGLFRCYTSTDVVGVECGASLKNVVAIACGVCDGAALGANARAAIITRGLGEITRIALRRGAQPLTLLGLAGMGDLVLTCTSELSRNYRVGLGLGQGRGLQEVLEGLGQVAEGVATARTGWLLAQQLGLATPLLGHVYGLLYEGHSIAQVLAAIAADDVPRAEWLGCAQGGSEGAGGGASAAP